MAAILIPPMRCWIARADSSAKLCRLSEGAGWTPHETALASGADLILTSAKKPAERDANVRIDHWVHPTSRRWRGTGGARKAGHRSAHPHQQATFLFDLPKYNQHDLEFVRWTHSAAAPRTTSQKMRRDNKECFGRGPRV